MKRFLALLVVASPNFTATINKKANAVFLFAVPLLAMRMLAEERRQQTLTLLLSAPVSITENSFPFHSLFP
jgi:ABC-2 type transport system permease protein